MNNKFFSKVFGWLFLGLLITFVTGFIISGNETILYNIFSTNIYWLLFIAEIVLVIVLSARISKMQTMTAIICYCLYSFVTGLTFSVLFISFDLASVIMVFGMTSVLFGLFALYGAFTKRDLSKLSSILFLGLIGTLIVGLINMFLGNGLIDIIISIIGLVIFLGLTAYDMQKMNYYRSAIPNENNAAIISAFELYLDFINIFIKLLRLFGRNRD